jgi:hypothetical protein
MKRVLLVAMVVHATSVAADPTANVKVAKDGTATIKLQRTMAEGAQFAKLTVKLPTGWKRDATTSDARFVLPSKEHQESSISLDVAIDNRDPKEVADAVKAMLSEDMTRFGGGKLVGLRSKPHTVELGPKAHGYVASYEIDATAERNIHYVQTTCYAYTDGASYAVRIVGFADVKEDQLVTPFETLCGGARFTK